MQDERRETTEREHENHNGVFSIASKTHQKQPPKTYGEPLYMVCRFGTINLSVEFWRSERKV
jgi:hypothetical protein